MVRVVSAGHRSVRARGDRRNDRACSSSRHCHGHSPGDGLSGLSLCRKLSGVGIGTIYTLEMGWWMPLPTTPFNWSRFISGINIFTAQKVSRTFSGPGFRGVAFWPSHRTRHIQPGSDPEIRRSGRFLFDFLHRKSAWML